MGAEAIIYPFIFIAIYFESFMLVTLLSAPARSARGRSTNLYEPSVAVIVPCWNEEDTIQKTTESLLALDYPSSKLEIILVNDGSTDGTRSVMEKFRNNSQVKIIHKENGGKHTALNAGIAATDAEIFGCLDADSFVEPDSLKEILKSFVGDDVAATTAAMSVYRPSTFLQHMQNAEYIFGIIMRHVFSSINGLYVTPGPFSFYKKDIVERLGGFRLGHQTEDMEMALRLQSEGYTIENAPRARVYTKAPSDLLRLLAQRTRWTTGFIRNVLIDYRNLILNPRKGALGMLVLPFGLMAIGSGILVFFTVLYMLGQRSLEAYEVREGIPLAYSMLPHLSSVDWFYLPTTVLLFMSITAVVTSVSLIIYSKNLSNTPGKIFKGIVSYLVAYGFVMPLWLIRSVADVTVGKKRMWR